MKDWKDLDAFVRRLAEIHSISCREVIEFITQKWIMEALHEQIQNRNGEDIARDERTEA